MLIVFLFDKILLFFPKNIGIFWEILSPSNLYIRVILLIFGKKRKMFDNKKNEKEKNPDHATSENWPQKTTTFNAELRWKIWRGGFNEENSGQKNTFAMLLD